MRTLLIVLVLCSMSILNAQQLNVATYNVRNLRNRMVRVTERALSD